MASGASQRLALCRELSGFGDVSSRFAEAALADLASRAGAAAVDAMIARFDSDGAAAVMADPAMQAQAQLLIGFLYTGFGPDGLPDDVPENHFESLMWRAALAHPPALSGGYFGHWFYPPEAANR